MHPPKACEQVELFSDDRSCLRDHLVCLARLRSGACCLDDTAAYVAAELAVGG